MSTLTFDTLKPTVEGYKKTVHLGGKPWGVLWWEESFRRLYRDVQAGRAEVQESGQGRGFTLEIVSPSAARTSIKCRHKYPTLESAVTAAEVFFWDVRNHAGVSWYATREDHWIAVLGEGDSAEIFQVGDEKRFVIKRSISPRWGEAYEISVSRYDRDGDEGTKLAVTTFEEAAAIALTLPTYLSALATPSHKQ